MAPTIWLQGCNGLDNDVKCRYKDGVRKTTKRKPGPKPIRKSELRSLLVGVPVNAQEMRTLRKAVGRGSLAAWAREILLASATEDPSQIGECAAKKATNEQSAAGGAKGSR